jgi:hypothetical protein
MNGKDTAMGKIRLYTRAEDYWPGREGVVK